MQERQGSALYEHDDNLFLWILPLSGAAVKDTSTQLAADSIIPRHDVSSCMEADTLWSSSVQSIRFICTTASMLKYQLCAAACHALQCQCAHGCKLQTYQGLLPHELWWMQAGEASALQTSLHGAPRGWQVGRRQHVAQTSDCSSLHLRLDCPEVQNS